MAARTQALLSSLCFGHGFGFISNQQVSNDGLVGAESSLEFLRSWAVQFKVGLEVETLVVFLNRVSKRPLAPGLGARNFTTDTGHKRSNFLDRLGALLFASITTENPDQFVLSQRFTVFFYLARNR